MPENPFLIPPQVESPASRSWGLGFAFGFQTAPLSQAAPDGFEPEDLDAFDLGVLAGQQSAIEGLAVVDVDCVDLHREPPAIQEFIGIGFEAFTIGKELAKKAYGGAIFGFLLLFVELSIAVQIHFDEPSEAIAHHTGVIRDTLVSMGITDSLELFVGGGINTSVVGCELMTTRVFRTIEGARAAVEAMGRPERVIVRWRTDQSGGLTVVESA